MPFPTSERVRETTAQACRVAGTLLVAFGLVLTYANRVVFDAAAFADRAASSLSDPRVAAYVGGRLADSVIARNRDLTAVRPVIVGTAEAVVASAPFRAVFRQASRTAHAVAFSEGAERVYLSIPDFGVLMRSTISQLRPELAERMESEGDLTLIEDVDAALGAGVLELLQLAARVRGWINAALGLGGVLLVSSVALPRRRRRALLRTGLAMAAAAAILFVLPGLFGGAFTARIGDPALQEAARGTWDSFAVGFQRWALLLAGMGIVLAAAASSLASHVEVERAALGAWRWLRQPGERPAAELVRGLALLGFGLFSALEPRGAVSLLAGLFGAIVTFEGLRSLFALVAPQLQEAPAHREEASGPRRVRYGLIALAAAGLVTLAAAYLRSPASLPVLRPLVTACNGDRALCDRALDEVVLPGAHNAMGSADVKDWMFPNQERGIPDQLRAGIRALLIDVHGGFPVAGRIKTDLEDEAIARRKFEEAIGKEAVDAAMRIRDRLVGEPTGPRGAYLCHGFCEIGAQPLVPVLSSVRDFLVENPGEVLVIVIEDYVTPEEIARAFEESGLLRLVYRGAPGPEWPTLGEMIASGQRVLVLAENEASGVPWYHGAFEVMQETPYHFEAPEEFSCAPNRGGTGGSLFQINHWIDTAPTPKPSNAEIVNARQFLLERARRCREERGMLPNILAVDFTMTGDVVGAAAELNGL